jgi:hypothetical protein
MRKKLAILIMTATAFLSLAACARPYYAGPPAPGAYWVPGHYVTGPYGGQHFVPGHWQ